MELRVQGGVEVVTGVMMLIPPPVSHPSLLMILRFWSMISPAQQRSEANRWRVSCCFVSLSTVCLGLAFWMGKYLVGIVAGLFLFLVLFAPGVHMGTLNKRVAGCRG